MPFSTRFPNAVEFSIGQRVQGDNLIIHVAHISYIIKEFNCGEIGKPTVNEDFVVSTY